MRRLVGLIRESPSQIYKNGSTRAVHFFIGLQWRNGQGDGENGGRLQNKEEDQIHPRALPHAYFYGINVFRKIVF
jgi:hypothetical protein